MPKKTIYPSAIFNLGQAQSRVWDVIQEHPEDQDLLDLWKRLRTAMERYGCEPILSIL